MNSPALKEPPISIVQKGIDICKKENIDFILAIGGGSTINCSKIIAIGAVLTIATT